MAASTQSTWAASRMKLENFTNKPENYLTTQNALAEDIKKLTKQFYDSVKSIEDDKPKDALPELIIENFDDEQIWQELELQNEEKCNMFVGQVAKLIAAKNKLLFPISRRQDENKSSSPELGDGGDSDEVESGDADAEPQEQKRRKKIHKKKTATKITRNIKPSVVDDKFFKLQDMEEFLQLEEKRGDTEKLDSDDESVDLFDDALSEDEDDKEDEKNDVDESSGLHYRDFFDAVEGEEEEEKAAGSEEEELSSGEEGSDGEEDSQDDMEDSLEDKLKSQQTNKKGVRFVEPASSSNDSEESEHEGAGEEDGPKSSFETRQDRLKQRIEKIHEDALGEKPWQLKGEITATNRPQNSLLEEVLQFDMTSRPAPVITEQTTIKLEDIIKQRVKDKAWDDVERKAKPVEAPSEYKKKLVLDQEKSKLSLSQIYEQDYMKKKKDVEPGRQEEEEEQDKEEPPEHLEIRKLMHSLFSKLDALSNYHFTPKPPAPEVKIITNLAAVTVEEVAPVSASDATLLAPEEVKAKLRGGLLGAEERTDTDKKRERRKKKTRQRSRKFAREKKQTEMEKLNPGLVNKFSKGRAAKEVEKATKEGTIKKLSESSSGKSAIKSSTAFFTHLQEEVTSLIKNKSQELKRKKGKESNVSAKRLKL